MNYQDEFRDRELVRIMTGNICRMAERLEGKLTVATRFSKGERAAMKRRRAVPISAIHLRL